MIKRIVYASLLVITAKMSAAQQPNFDSLVQQAEIAKNDTAKIILYSRITDAYTEINPDSAFYYADKVAAMAGKLKLRLTEAYAMGQMGYALLNMGNYPRSLKTFLSAIAIAEDPKSEKKILQDNSPEIEEFANRPSTPHNLRLDNLARLNQDIGILYGNASDYKKELAHYILAKKYAEQTGNVALLSIINSTMGRVYLSLKKPDSALMHTQKAYDLAIKFGYKRYLGSTLLNFGKIYAAKDNMRVASEYFRKALLTSLEENYLRGVVAANLLLADLYRESGKRDSSLYYSNSALATAQYLNAPSLLLRSYTTMAEFYRSANNNDSAVKYQALIIKMNDSLFNLKQAQQFQNIDFDEQQRQKEIEAAKISYRNRMQVYALLTGLAVFLLLAIILWRNNRHRQKAYLLLQKQKQETDKQKAKAEETLTELKSAQAQLIQSEKMASLGELTAGIAHEIQNPLNFINNFSEVNSELIDELKAEFRTGNARDAETIADNIKVNNIKITEHGQRADAIVKGMLLHSRTSSGQKEPTNLNALTDEYLRLSYHGLRAKDKTFNVTMITDFDEFLSGESGKINIIPQDIGRVLLNLLNNAFYAVTEKKLSIARHSVSDDGYEPTVTISTKALKNPQTGGGTGAIIAIRDNGIGIEQKVMDKIFQPFFTTKAAGQGTGLGLSMSYDIIKAHGGELKVTNHENGGAEFIIELPWQ
jgi:Signal transduction histidine kinase regulating C4-dicarboxylate transport system